MTEKPILFSGGMVTAIQRQKKTQTRRLVRWPSGHGFTAPSHPVTFKRIALMPPRANGQTVEWRVIGEDGSWLAPLHCPYGEIGGHLWVKETWSPDAAKHIYPFETVYRADFTAYDDPLTAGHNHVGEEVHNDCYACLRNERGFKWRPSIHMPRTQSRMKLQIANIWIERLHTISGGDCVAEGIDIPLAPGVDYCIDGEFWPPGERKLRAAYAALWDSINLDRAPWSDNPYVWAIAFRRVFG